MRSNDVTPRPLLWSVFLRTVCNQSACGSLTYKNCNSSLVDLGFTTLLTSQVISVAFYSEREKSDKFCSEAVISARGSFTYRKSTTRDSRLYTPFRRKSYSGFLRCEKIHRLRPGSNPRTSNSEASMITTGPPGSAKVIFMLLSFTTLFNILGHQRRFRHTA